MLVTDSGTRRPYYLLNWSSIYHTLPIKIVATSILRPYESTSRN